MHVCLFILCVYMYTVYTSVYACTQVSWSQHDIWGRVIQLFLWIPYKGQYCRNSRPSGYDHPLSGEITHVWTITGPSASSWLHFTNSRLHLDHGCVLPVSALCLRCANSPSWARNLRNTRLHTDPATAKQCFWTLNASTACQRNAGIPTNEWLSENTTPWHFQIPLATQ